MLVLLLTHLCFAPPDRPGVTYFYDYSVECEADDDLASD